MSNVLFLAHRIPFPPDRGDKIRAHHLLRRIAEFADVHIGCFAEVERDWAAESELAAVASSYCLLGRTKPLPWAGLEALAQKKPVSLTAFYSQKLRDWVSQTLAEKHFDAIVIFSGQMGQYIPADFQGQVVVDLCDVDSAKFDAYGEEGRFPRSWIDRREGQLLRAEEARLVERADIVTLISDNEIALLRSRLGENCDADIRALSNGIDANFFDPALSQPHPELSATQGPHLVFTGQMDYPPNVAACQRVIENILPQIQARYPSAKFHIVGRAPVSDLLERHGEGGVHVWGEVPDVRPFVAAADCVIAPLSIARGIQNKVLEAMAMARPVVLTPEAATGINAVDGEQFAIGADDDALVEQLDTLIEGKSAADAMGAAARAFVCEHQSWEAMLAPLGSIVLGQRMEVHHADD